MTRDELRAQMLSRISADYDKSEGEFFYDAIDPVAIELEKSYEAQGGILDNAFVGTAAGEYLDRKCAELGIVRRAATKSTGQVEITGAQGAAIPKGALVATELVSFVIAEEKTIGAGGAVSVQVECTEYGSIGNVPASTIKYFPVTLEGLTAATNPAPFVNGFDAETDESMRERYKLKATAPATSGNKAHYELWAKEVTGVGGAKVFPLWDGAGTVKIIICNANKRAADGELIGQVEAHIEKERPIGASVTIESASEKAISITATIVLAHGVDIGQVKTALEDALTNYFMDAAFVDSYISYAKIGSILYDVYGVADYSALKVNGGTGNVMLTETEMPALGTVVLT